MRLRSISLEDRFTATEGSVLANGHQALLIALLRQRRFDRLRGLSTGGFLSGYRGSPLSSLDAEAERAAKHLAGEAIRFEPGINEDLALTAVWGSQQVALDPNACVQGVVGMWYGKGAGLDRCGDALRHAHGAGSSRYGGVLVVCGDDHALKSSAQAYHSEPTFIDMQMPVLAPSDLQDVLDYAILGYEMSRYSGCYVGFKVLAEHVNATGVLEVGLERIHLDLPADLGPENDRWIRWPDPWPEVERRVLDIKLPAALDFARANALNRPVSRAAHPKLGIVASGKSYADVVDALALIGMSVSDATEHGISIFKIGMPWPVDEPALRSFCRDHPTILVVEEKRDLIESQIRSCLYGAPNPPIVLGRRDRAGKPQFPMVGELDAHRVLQAIAAETDFAETTSRRLEAVLARSAPALSPLPARPPYFCSGCPHNRSTKVPEGSRALAGVGCHFMATGMDRSTETFTQMGGEGVPWIGTHAFTNTGHVFINLGEGTYFHSGSLAIRAALAAGVTATYKILFNDAIAMTGGQAVEGELTVPIIARQLQAEGVKRIEVVAEDPSVHRDLPHGVGLSGRDDLDKVQRDLRDVPGVSVLIFDQVCATEKQRRRKRGKMPAAPRRVFINERVCEGCGDCSVQSNCLSVVPVETEFGRKRKIDQTSCNQDYSCTDGFCPSFVTIEGAKPLKSATRPLPDLTALPEPDLPALDGPLDIVVAGVGGTGIVTISALLAMAAHLEGMAFRAYDKLGMAQKYGAVSSHLRLSPAPEEGSVRIPDGHARLLIAGDLRVAAEPAVTRLLDRSRAHAVVATEQAVDGGFVRDRDFDFQAEALTRVLKRTVDDERIDLVPAQELAQNHLGERIGANLLLLGHAWQKGLLPISRAAIERAIELNGVAVELNKTAFALGRYLALNPDAETIPQPAEPSLDELIEQRSAFLTAYQDSTYAARYRRLVETVAAAERKAAGDAGPLTRAVAENFAKLLAYKDEYEVARLFTDGPFQAELARTFEPGGKLTFHLAPPILSGRDPDTGRPRKRRFGPWVLPMFRVLARMRRLRGTVFDPFGWLPDRREERALARQYETDFIAIAATLGADTIDRARERAELPQMIRGYGPVKRQSVADAERRREALLSQDATGSARPIAAE